ncbi:MAG: M48 family metallopeptidase, partial [Nitrospira sp.]|nr:M48 family metallopeptidase [Nitrospira sp.]
MRLRTIRRVSAVFCLAGVTALVAGGCSVIAGVVHGARTGNWGYAIGAGINHGIRTIDYVASSAAESMANDEVPERFSPEQEYYIGRGVSASLVDSMGVPPAGDATDTQLRYLNEMAGYITVANPDGSALWRGVRVGIVESSEIGAYATPGGFVWISRGTLKLCTSEEELAAVLCHELGHVAHGHAIEAYRKDGGGKVKPNPWIKNLGKVAPLPRASGNFFGGLATRIAENRYTVDQEE